MFTQDHELLVYKHGYFGDDSCYIYDTILQRQSVFLLTFLTLIPLYDRYVHNRVVLQFIDLKLDRIETCSERLNGQHLIR